MDLLRDAKQHIPNELEELANGRSFGGNHHSYSYSSYSVAGSQSGGNSNGSSQYGAAESVSVATVHSVDLTAEEKPPANS